MSERHLGSVGFPPCQNVGHPTLTNDAYSPNRTEYSPFGCWLGVGVPDGIWPAQVDKCQMLGFHTPLPSWTGWVSGWPARWLVPQLPQPGPPPQKLGGLPSAFHSRGGLGEQAAGQGGGEPDRAGDIGQHMSKCKPNQVICQSIIRR